MDLGSSSVLGFSFECPEWRRVALVCDSWKGPSPPSSPTTPDPRTRGVCYLPGPPVHSYLTRLPRVPSFRHPGPPLPTTLPLHFHPRSPETHGVTPLGDPETNSRPETTEPVTTSYTSDYPDPRYKNPSDRPQPHTDLEPRSVPGTDTPPRGDSGDLRPSPPRPLLAPEADAIRGRYRERSGHFCVTLTQSLLVSGPVHPRVSPFNGPGPTMSRPRDSTPVSFHLRPRLSVTVASFPPRTTLSLGSHPSSRTPLPTRNETRTPRP